MRTHLLVLAAVTLLQTAPLKAQVIPGEAPGDLGWILYGTDTLVLVRTSDGNVWLQQNLGSTEVATVANASNAYGYLYQWGRWDDGHQVRTSPTAPVTTLAVNNPSGLGTGSPLFYTGTDPLHWWSGGSGTDSWQGAVASAANGIDPCTALGADWRLPSQSDWMDVLAAEGITGLATALSGNLRLPAAGSRHALTGTLINEGMFGNYWCSTPSDIYAKDLTIGDGFVNANDDGYRGYGMSCRCLNKDLHTGIREQVSTGLALFPNPSDGIFTLRCDETMLRIWVLDATGRVVAAIPVNALSATVELSHLSAGLHTVRVETVHGVRHVRLVIAK
jgi:hypothetical protein